MKYAAHRTVPPLKHEVLIQHFREAPRDVRRNGRQWYPLARREALHLARENGITLAQAAGIIASASRNQSWKGNLKIAAAIASGNPCGLTCVQRECAQILAGTPPTRAISGPKRVAFYRNIMGQTAPVTVDRWAARAALGCDEDTARRLLNRSGGYESIATMYREAARALRISPRDLQAIVWIQVRGSHA